MQSSLLQRLFGAYQNAIRATDPETYNEALADIRVAGRESVPAAIASALVLIQIEKPIVLPLTLMAGVTSLLLFVKRMVS